MLSTMLTVEESSILSSLLSADQRPLEEIMADLDSKFPSSLLRFRVCFHLSGLLEEKPLLNPSQRLVAFCLLHGAYSSQHPSANPFVSHFVNVACDEEAEKYERALVLQLLGASSIGSGKEVLKQSVADYIKGFNPSLHVFPSLEQLQEQYGGKAGTDQYNCLLRDTAVKNVIPDPDAPPRYDANSIEFDLQPGSNPKIGSGDRDETIAGLLQNLSLEGIERQWISPLPPRLPIQDGELVWLNSGSSHELLWDYSMCADTSRGAVVKDPIAKALEGPLSSTQEQAMLMQERGKQPIVQAIQNEARVDQQAQNELDQPHKNAGKVKLTPRELRKALKREEEAMRKKAKTLEARVKTATTNIQLYLLGVKRPKGPRA